MKATYTTPAIDTVRINATPLLTLSGGGKGDEGDHGESRSFWGPTIFDEEEESYEEN